MIRRTAAKTDHAATSRDDAQRALNSELLRACTAAANGELDARIAPVPGTEEHEDLQVLRSAVNLLLERADGYVRETATTLRAASEGRFDERLPVAATAGAFRTGAETTNSVVDAVSATHAELSALRTSRAGLAERLEMTVATVAQRITESASQLAASAASLAESAHQAGSEADTAGTAVQQVNGASQEIQDVVRVISAIADQTRLLALNATIEAARAGEAGRGFAVVASEVKSLADSTAQSTDRITGQVEAMRQVADASGSAMDSVETTVRAMTDIVDVVSVAVNGRKRTKDVKGVTGLAEMAELLRDEVADLLSELRQG